MADPYRWLEGRNCPETEEWLADQGKRFKDYFQRLGSLDPLRSRVREFLDVDATDQIGKVQGRYFYRKRRVGEQQASIYVMDSHARAEHVLVDPRILGIYASVGIYRISKDGNMVAYELKQGGEHSKAIHVVETNSRRTLTDHLPTGLSRGFAFRHAADGFYYCHDFLGNDPMNPLSNHQVRFHRFGTDIADDEVLLSFPRSYASKLVFNAGDKMLSAVLYQKRGDQYLVDLHVGHQDCHGSWNRIAQNVPAPFNPFINRDKLLVVSYDRAPKGQIVELDPIDCHQIRVVVPEWKVPITRLTVIHDRIYINYLVGAEAAVRIWSFDGEYLGEIPLEKGCTWDILPTYSSEAEELFLSRESFTKPPTLYSFSVDTRERAVWSQNSVAALNFPIAYQKSMYTAEDGTSIAILLVSSSTLSLKDRPVVMTAYGGFGVTLTPQFSAFISIMLERGFVFALPEIRGGGEHGTDWHEAARRRSRQVAIDDFIAAAKWICEEGITKPAKLAIFGGSNSGLLVGAAITQRPDLFGAGLCVAPLLDMVRYHRFDRAHVWAQEYGTSDDPDDFEALYNYSPYHHVEEGRNYPSLLFVTGDKDTRCNPAHARKMTAQLQNRVAQISPILLDYNPQRGHSPTMPLAVRIDALVHRIAFLCGELGVATHEEHCPVRLISSASGCLLKTEWYLQRHREKPLQSVLEGIPTAEHNTKRYSVQLVCRAIDVACVLYFKEVKCLQRSVALTMLLRRYGLAAELVIGGQIVPPKFHAWVEMDGLVVNDKSYVSELYRELQRC
ncbi:prolyl oligopeptidase [Silvibacterium bohemicum]|uniref:prolyl oligopeptidase n=1 Tax=Silvibacterium bohemicum TaxID=1577686 RepID=A0A841JTA6_9BACT|nr:prolyl oligopeptidase [Silvibacterium bohemicum]